MSRIGHAFRSFFAILFQGELSEDIAKAYGYARPQPPPPPPPPQPSAADGALQLLGILQRDSRLLDFLMEDIAAYSDDQVCAAVRSMHESARGALNRYLTLNPVIDGVEGTPAKASAAPAGAIKFVGNVPSGPPPKGGTLRHRGWKAAKVDLPVLAAKQDVTILAPAEIEIE